MLEKNDYNKPKSTIKKISIYTSIIILSLLFCLLSLELILRTGLFDGEDNPNPVWIPTKFQKLDKKINRNNWKFAKHNLYRFTDNVRKIEKKNGVVRIAVLGDSVIWGTGLPYEQVWSHKLEKMIIERYKNYEVMSWGQGAWSTMDELLFLEKHGIQYDIDTLIVSWVDNDPDMGNIKDRTYSWQKNILIKVLKVFFPNAISFIVSYTNNFLTTYIYTDHQYHNWLKQLYSDENLVQYAEVLQDLSSFCNSKNIKLLFVLIPQMYDESIREEFNKIIPLLEKANIKYLNLFPAVKNHLGHIPQRELWANPGNGHPGPLLTDLYAKYVFSYLQNKRILSQSGDFHGQMLLKQYRKKRSDPDALKALLNIALNDTDWENRKEAAIALGKITNPLAVDLLIPFLKDKNPDIREAASDALGEINDPRTVELLITMLQDEINHVRKRAVLSLEKKRDTRSIRPLITTALKDYDKSVRRRALMAISKMEDPRVTECLIQSLKDKFYYNRKIAIIALGKTKNPRAVGPLIALLNDNRKGIRQEAVEALGEFNEPQVVEALKVASLKDKNPYVRDLAADSIKKITGEEYGKYRRKLLRILQMF